MSVMRTIGRLRHRLFGAMGAALLVLFLLLVAFASSSQLHQALHPDANTAGHHCSISALSHGQIEPPACDAPLRLASPCWNQFRPSELSVFGFGAELLPPGRGPPIVFS